MAYHGVTEDDSIHAIEALFKADVDPTRIAAIIIEPVLGEGGFYVAPPGFLAKLRAICNQHGIVLIADEIQTGFARTGRMFAFEHSGVAPDLITVAKSVAGGVPLAGVIGRADLMDSVPPGGLGGTYAGSPLACAAGLAVLDVIRDERLCERAERVGQLIGARLTDLQSRWRCIGDVRRLGAMVAMELVKDRNAAAPDPDLTRALVQAAGRRGLILLSCGLYSNVIRILAPLTIPDAQLAEGLAILEAAMEDVAVRAA
jgi:4-aminobutyrate aminotransferase/(S)-3-amino-2-methylpropionate transaminase